MDLSSPDDSNSFLALDSYHCRGLGHKLGKGVQLFVTMIGGLAFGFWASWRISLLVLTIVSFMTTSNRIFVENESDPNF
jgi:ABC-type multidrug transport system fused ATPase/permease subunit